MASLCLRLLPSHSLSQPFLHSNIHHHHRLSPPLSKPLKTFAPISASNTSPPAPISASNTSPPATDRLISAASYVFPLFNGVQYGRFLWERYPIIAVPLKPAFPLLSLYHSFPITSLISFFTLYLLVVRNPRFSRYVRLNALQAFMLDVLLELPLLRVRIISLPRLSFRDVLLAVPWLIHRVVSPDQTGVEMKLFVGLSNSLFVFVIAFFVYGLVSSVLGKTPHLPFLSEAAGRKLD